jgi:hypothetical protein
MPKMLVAAYEDMIETVASDRADKRRRMSGRSPCCQTIVQALEEGLDLYANMIAGRLTPVFDTLAGEQE